MTNHVQRHYPEIVRKLSRTTQTGMAKVCSGCSDNRGMAESARTVVVVSNHGALLERVVTDAGFSVVGQAEFAVNAEHLIGHYKPDVVVVENELVGMTGMDAMGGMRTASPASQFVLVVADDWKPANRGDVGAFAVVPRSDLTELEAELNALDDWLDDQSEESVSESERRHGRDRRTRQDWSKVGWERRVGSRRDHI